MARDWFSRSTFCAAPRRNAVFPKVSMELYRARRIWNLAKNWWIIHAIFCNSAKTYYLRVEVLLRYFPYISCCRSALNQAEREKKKQEKAHCIVISMFQTWDESLTGYGTLCIQTSVCYPGLSGPGECKTNFELPQISILKTTENSVLRCTCLLQAHANSNTLKIAGKSPVLPSSYLRYSPGQYAQKT